MELLKTTNSNGNNERVLTHNIAKSSVGTPSVSIIPPATATVNRLLRMRVISDYTRSPVLCGSGGYVIRADDYGIFVSSALGLTDFSNSKLKMYPNPVQGYLSISLPNNGAIKGYEVYDISGEKVMFNSKFTNNKINVSSLSNGFYFLKVDTGTVELISKFIKE